MQDAPIALEKAALRAQIRSQRRARTPQQRDAAAQSLAEVILAEIGNPRRIAAYLSSPSEPGTGPLLDRLAAAGTSILLPVAAAEEQLDWVASGSGQRPGPLGVPEPIGPRLGPAALDGAQAVIVPAAAVDARGLRLGWGRGFYDRALAARTGTAPVIAVVYEDERLDALPDEPHDVPVDAVATPTGLQWFHAPS